MYLEYMTLKLSTTRWRILKPRTVHNQPTHESRDKFILIAYGNPGQVAAEGGHLLW